MYLCCYSNIYLIIIPAIMFLHSLKRLLPLKLLSSPFSTANLRLKHVSDILVLNERRRYLNKVLLPKHKLSLHAQKRPLNSTIVSLKSQNKCAAVIKGRSGYPELDIVLDGIVFKKLNKDEIKKNRLIYVRLDGEEIICSIDKIELFEERFVSKVFLNRFIEGEPNELEVVVQPTELTTNPHLKAGQAILSHATFRVKIITYNLDYPPVLTYSVTNINPMRPYKFADLANTLPPGIYLHPLVNLDRKIFEIAMPEDRDDDEDDMAKIEKMKELDKLQNKLKKDEKKGAAGAAGAPAAGDAKDKKE